MEEGELFKYLVEFHKGIGIELRTGLDWSSWKKVSMVTSKVQSWILWSTAHKRLYYFFLWKSAKNEEEDEGGETISGQSRWVGTLVPYLPWSFLFAVNLVVVVIVFPDWEERHPSSSFLWRSSLAGLNSWFFGLEFMFIKYKGDGDDDDY
jgi:hypothetical protein